MLGKSFWLSFLWLFRRMEAWNQLESLELLQVVEDEK
jgi:hypothetical protein